MYDLIQEYSCIISNNRPDSATIPYKKLVIFVENATVFYVARKHDALQVILRPENKDIVDQLLHGTNKTLTKKEQSMFLSHAVTLYYTSRNVIVFYDQNLMTNEKQSY